MKRLVTATPFIVVSLWFLWGSSFIPIKTGLTVAPPPVFAVTRVLMTAAVLLIALGMRRLRSGPRVFDPRVHRFGIVLGVLNGFIFLTLQNMAMVDAGAALSSVLIYTQPLMVAIGARIVFGERLSPRRIVGLVAGWSGVIILVFGELDAGSAPLTASLMLLGAAFAWSLATLTFKWLPANVDALRLLLWQNLYGLVPLSLVMLLRADYDITVGVTLFVSVFYVAVAASIGGYGLQFVLLRRGEAGVVSSWLFAVPIVASLLGVVLLNEAVHAGLLLGGPAVALGIYLVNSTRTHKRPFEPVLPQKA
ncbi:MAG: DMT family transporter [Nitriliruptoraceae bacterium]